MAERISFYAKATNVDFPFVHVTGIVAVTAFSDKCVIDIILSRGL